MARELNRYHFDLSGGNTALSFANTISWRGHPSDRKDHLNEPVDLISFAVQEKILTPKEALIVERRPDEPRKFRRALSLRESIYRVFAAIARGKTPPSADVSALNDCAVAALGHRQLVRSNEKYRWQWKSGPLSSLDHVLWPIAIAAAELLTSEDVKLVRLCQASDCGWLFLDNSRNRSRRWCDMKSCGNRAKARRHYERWRE